MGTIDKAAQLEGERTANELAMLAEREEEHEVAPPIWNYSAISGILLSQGWADPDPLEPGRWLVPAFATMIEPPDAKPGFNIVFKDEAWDYELIPEPEPAPEDPEV